MTAIYKFDRNIHQLLSVSVVPSEALAIQTILKTEWNAGLPHDSTLCCCQVNYWTEWI